MVNSMPEPSGLLAWINRAACSSEVRKSNRSILSNSDCNLSLVAPVVKFSYWQPGKTDNFVCNYFRFCFYKNHNWIKTEFKLAYLAFNYTSQSCSTTWRIEVICMPHQIYFSTTYRRCKEVHISEKSRIDMRLSSGPLKEWFRKSNFTHNFCFYYTA